MVEKRKAQRGTVRRAVGRSQQPGKGARALVFDVDPSESLDNLRRWKRELGDPPFLFALDPGSRVTLAYGVRATDTKMFIDRTGRLVERVDGRMLSDGELLGSIGKILRS